MLPKFKSAKVRVMRAYILCRADQTSKAGIYGTVFYFVWVSAEWAFNLLNLLRCSVQLIADDAVHSWNLDWLKSWPHTGIA